MKKNNIFIVIDSIYYDRTIKTDEHESPMPFLNKLRSEGLDFSNMYSEAPYTEAALVSLLCGQDTLKNGGYMKKLYNKKTMMEVFKENGYDTFCSCTQPQVYPSYAYPGLTEEHYNVCYDFSILWSYRFEFYSKKHKENILDSKTYSLLSDLLEDNLITWKNFMISLRDNGKITDFIYKYVDKSNISENLDLLNYEIDKFNKDKINYVKNLLDLGLEHNLFKIKTYNLSKKMSVETRKIVNNKYKKLIREMLYKNFYYNLKNNKLVLNPKKERSGLVKAYINCIYNRFLKEKIDYRVESKKAAPSMDTTINYFEDWVVNRKNDNPYFAYIHVDDCHSKEIFYTYDTEDLNKLDEEFSLINSYLKNLPKKYKGSISYDVSLQYADLCLKRLYNFLHKHDMLDNVNIFICADHGSSYTFYPYRSNYVNNVHRENYNMPFVIWSKDLKHKKYNGLYNTKDIPATIIDINKLKIPKSYDGMSIIKNESRDYVLMENVLGGCPDYNLRDFWLGVRNKNYLVVLILNYNKNFEDYKIHSVYNLKNDSMELHNLKDTIDEKQIKSELDILKREFEILKKDMQSNNFLNKK